jgi:hypothetical protein
MVREAVAAAERQVKMTRFHTILMIWQHEKKKYILLRFFRRFTHRLSFSPSESKTRGKILALNYTGERGS